MPTGYARLSYESIVGNEHNVPVLSTKKLFPPLISLGPKLNPAHLERDDELRNQDEPLSVLPEIYDPTWDMALRCYPDSMAFLLKLALGAPVSTAGDGIITDLSGSTVDAGATRHRWTAPFGPTGVSPLTAQLDVAYSDQAVYFKGKGGAVSELSIESPAEGGARVEVSGPVLYLDRQSNPSLTPAFEALTVRPFTRGSLIVSALAGGGTIEDFSVAISNPVERVRSLTGTFGVQSRYADVLEKDNEGPIVVTATIPKRQLDADDFDALRNATGHAVTAVWWSDTLIGTTAYKMAVKFNNAQYMEGEPDPLSNRRRHGLSLSLKSTTPSTGSTTFEVCNATASYA